MPSRQLSEIPRVNQRRALPPLGPVCWGSIKPAAAGVLVLLLAACGGTSTHAGSTHPSTVAAPPSANSLHGLIPSPPPRKPSFVLVSTSGRPFDLTRQTQGRLTYLYFGYTHCPNACPATMADISLALHRQPRAIRRQIVVVFVTTDPRRDTPAVLRSWLDRFDPTFVGLTGSSAQIAYAEQAAGVPLARPEPVAGGGYSVAHSTQVFAYSPDGLAHVFYLDGNQPADYANDMPLLLRFR